MSRVVLPIALTIAGSDSGGGAGLQADLKVFAALGVHGTSVVTCLTAQNPAGVTAVQAVHATMVRAQLEAVFDGLRPAAAKTGMLYSARIIREVAGFWATGRKPPLVVDPVMVATSGAMLLRPDALRALRDELLPLATVVTPNVAEAQQLVGTPLRTVEDLRAAARQIVRQFGCAALVKGGHLRGLRCAVDVFQDGQTELLLQAPFVPGVRTHGTGCTCSAAIAAELARGVELAEAVTRAKRLVTQSILRAGRAGRFDVLNPLGTRPG